MLPRITVAHRHDLSFDIQIRGHAVISDGPVTRGGDDEGPTPTELMVAGLAACAAEVTTGRLIDLGVPHEPLEVSADFCWDAAGQRIVEVKLLIALPTGIEEGDREAVLAAVLGCPARRLLAEPPEVDIEMPVRPAPLQVAATSAEAGGWPPEPPPDVDSEG